MLPLSAILLDIEGTTTPIDFVYETLFPFARARVVDYLETNLDTKDLRTDLEALKREHESDLAQGLDPPPWPPGFSFQAIGPRDSHGASDELDLRRAREGPHSRGHHMLHSDEFRDPQCAPLSIEEASGDGINSDARPDTDSDIRAVTVYVHWLMDRDRKSQALKSLQGKIWRRGYEDGSLRGRVFPDVPRALEEWRARAVDVYIFSSGSVLAQWLLFAHSEAGDLTPFIRGYFDTAVGPKTSSESYRLIARDTGVPPPQILFVSDVAAELDAAQSAGLRTLLCARPGNHPQPDCDHPIVHNFEEIVQ